MGKSLEALTRAFFFRHLAGVHEGRGESLGVDVAPAVLVADGVARPAVKTLGRSHHTLQAIGIEPGARWAVLGSLDGKLFSPLGGGPALPTFWTAVLTTQAGSIKITAVDVSAPTSVVIEEGTPLAVEFAGGTLTITAETVGCPPWPGPAADIAEAINGVPGFTAVVTGSGSAPLDPGQSPVAFTPRGAGGAVTIGEGENGEAIVYADEPGDPVDVEVVEGLEDGALAADLSDGHLVITLGMDAGVQAFVDIVIDDSGPGATMRVTVDEPGTGGNGLGFRFISNEGFPDEPLTAMLVGPLGPGGEVRVFLGTDGAGDHDDTKNTATLIAAAVDAIDGVSAELLITGCPPSDGGSSVQQTSTSAVGFQGGADPEPDPAKNSATQVAAKINLLAGVYAVPSGTGADPLTGPEGPYGFQAGGGVEVTVDGFTTIEALIGYLKCALVSGDPGAAKILMASGH